MIIDPWGKVLAELSGTNSEPEIATVDIDLSQIGKIREEMNLIRRT